MFNTEEDYFNAIRHAEVYKTKTKPNTKKLLILNFFFLAFLAYVTFSYLQSTKNTSIVKEAVLGVSETIEDSMKVLMSESSIQSKSSYTGAIARELDDKSGFKGRIAVVKYGDTLSSISEKYYGDTGMLSKIVTANQDLISQNSMLIVGQTIKIPN